MEHFYVLRQVLPGIYRHVYPDKKVLVHEVGRGESTGLSQAMSDRSFPGELVPIKESVAYRGGPQTIDSLREECPADVSRLLARENGMNHDTLQMIDDILGKDLDSRIAHQLLDLGSRIGKDTEDGIRPVVKLTRKEISEMVGCAQESAIRVMSEWEKKGWINTDRKFITLICPDRLGTYYPRDYLPQDCLPFVLTPRCPSLKCSEPRSNPPTCPLGPSWGPGTR